MVLRWCSGLRSKENVDACQNISCVKHPILTYHLFIDYIPCEYICVFDIDSINEWYYNVSCLGGYLGLLIISLVFHRMFSRYIKSAIVWYTCFYSFKIFYIYHIQINLNIYEQFVLRWCLLFLWYKTLHEIMMRKQCNIFIDYLSIYLPNTLFAILKESFKTCQLKDFCKIIFLAK